MPMPTVTVPGVVLAAAHHEAGVKVHVRGLRDVRREVGVHARVELVGRGRERDAFGDGHRALHAGHELEVHGVLPAVRRPVSTAIDVMFRASCVQRCASSMPLSKSSHSSVPAVTHAAGAPAAAALPLAARRGGPPEPPAPPRPAALLTPPLPAACRCRCRRACCSRRRHRSAAPPLPPPAPPVATVPA